MNKLRQLFDKSSRLWPLLLLCAFCFVILLYGIGRFELPFIDREKPVSYETDIQTNAPAMDDDDKIVEEQIGGLGVGDSISGVSPAVGDKEEDSVGGSGEQSGQEPSEDIYYHTFGELLSTGYTPVKGDYRFGEMIFGEVFFPFVLTRDEVLGMKKIISDTPKLYEEGGERFYAVGEKETYRFAVEIYMGLILLNDKTSAEVYTYDGTSLGSYSHSELIPAFARDGAGNPLFIDYSGRYFYLDIENGGRKMYSGYVDSTDSIGLYFNYSSSFGKNDNGMSIFKNEELVSFRDELDTKDFYILSSVDPRLAYYIQKLRPDYAAKIARYNPRFAEALEKAKDKIAEEAQYEDAETVYVHEAAAFPTVLPLSAIEPEVGEATESTPEAETVTGSAADTEELVTDSTDEAVTTEVAPGTEDTMDTEDDTDTDSAITEDSNIPEETELPEDTDTPAVTEPAVTAPIDPNILVIERSELLFRYGYGYTEAETEYKYAKAYPFSEGRAAVVDDKGVLRFINVLGDVVIDGTGVRMVTSSRYVTSEYAEPLYRHSENAKGHLYFDNGLVRVRKIERDYTYRNLIYSDSDVLLYPDGSEFDIPHGYELVAYSDGVLVLKGQNGKFGYYHKNGYWIAQPIYTHIRPFSEALGVIGFEGGMKGVIDREGRVVIPFIYDHITSSSDGALSLYSVKNGWKILVKMSGGV